MMRIASLFAVMCLVFQSAANGQSARYGESFLLADDFTGDGIDDLIVCDPGAENGQGSLYIFHGPVASEPLPAPAAADEVVVFSAPGLLDTGWRIKQACDYNFDSVRDLYIGATLLHDDGTTDDRVLIVTPVSWRVMTDVRGDSSVPDFWQSFDGTECEDGEWIEIVVRGWGYDLQGGDDSSSSSSSESGFSVINVVEYSLVLFDWNPQQWANNIALFTGICTSASEAARGAFPIDDTMSGTQRESQKWKRNAMRHALWQGVLAYRFGVDAAEEIGNIHEQDSEDGLDSWIDQYNNQVARNIAEQCLMDGCTIEELIQRLLDALEDGRFIRSPCDPRVPAPLRPEWCSDQQPPVPIGDVNSDGVIDGQDIIRTVEELGTGFATGDLNANGLVDSSDLIDIVLIVEGQQ